MQKNYVFFSIRPHLKGRNLPGVTIGSNTIIGAKSVVTKDIPDNVIAVGNPCRVLRPITEKDKIQNSIL